MYNGLCIIVSLCAYFEVDGVGSVHVPRSSFAGVPTTVPKHKSSKCVHLANGGQGEANY